MIDALDRVVLGRWLAESAEAVDDDAIDRRDCGHVADDPVAHHGDGDACSMSAYAALPFEPIMPKVDPGRDSTAPGRAGL